MTDGDKVADFALGYNYIDMAVDFFDDYVSMNLKIALSNATMSNDPMTNQITPSHYTSNCNIQNLLTTFGQELNPDENIAITLGGTEAIYSAIAGHTSEGDEWIVIEPAYSMYLPTIKMTRGVVKATSLKLSKQVQDKTKGEDWLLDKEELISLFNTKTKGIVLNNPLNPLGKDYSLDELQFIADLAKKYDTLVISDEIHEWTTHKPHIRFGSLPEMFERTITIGSASKSFSVSGWRLGWAFGHVNILNNLKTVHKNLVYFSPTLPQIAIAYGFEEEIRNFGLPSSYFVSHRQDVKRNRDLMIEAFIDAGMRLTIADGGTCMHVDWSPLKSRLPKIRGALDFAKWLVKNVGILGIPATSYYSDEHKYMSENYMRFCFNKKYDNLVEAARRLKKLKHLLK